MSSKRIIRLGDPTTHGGVVVSAAARFQMFGKPVARLGDKVTCRVRGHGECTIVEGDPLWSIDGIPVALEGHKTSCGASLISTLPNVTRRYEGMETGSVSMTRHVQESSHPRSGATSEQSPKDRYDERVRLIVGGNAALPGLPYYIETADGRSYSGRADDQGLLPRIETSEENQYTVYWGDEALAKQAEGGE